MFGIGKNKECPAEESFKTEIQNTKDLIGQQIDTLNVSIEKGFKDVSNAQKQSNSNLDTYTKKMDTLVFGNGEQGLKTKVAVVETNIKSLEDDINSVGEKGRDVETKVHKRIDDALKEVEKVGRETLVNSTKIYVFCGIIALLATLASIFVPMAIGV